MGFVSASHAPGEWGANFLDAQCKTARRRQQGRGGYDARGAWVAHFIRTSKCSQAAEEARSLMPALEEYFRTMARNNRWSNYRLHRACAAIPTDEYFRDRGAFFRSVHGTLNHILLIDRHYLSALDGTGGAKSLPFDLELCSDLSGLTIAQQAEDQRLMVLCNQLTPAGLDRTVHWSGSDNDAWHDSVHVVLAHLFLHQIHHRGQVHNMLSIAGFTPPQLDEFLLSHDAPLRDMDLRKLGMLS
jgi:uncharacterized damage-inducible protein DinB